MKKVYIECCDEGKATVPKLLIEPVILETKEN